MKCKIKKVRRDIGFIESTQYHWSSDRRPERITRTCAEMYNGDEAEINEDEIRTHYGKERLTYKTIEQLNNDLHNRYVEYENGMLLGDLKEYI